MQGRRGARQGGPRGRAQAWGEAYTRTHVRGMCEVLVTRYAELHAHSAFSFLDGANQPEELVEIGRASCRERGEVPEGAGELRRKGGRRHYDRTWCSRIGKDR